MRLKLLKKCPLPVDIPVDRVDEAQMRLKLTTSAMLESRLGVDRVDEAQMRLKHNNININLKIGKSG